MSILVTKPCEAAYTFNFDGDESSANNKSTKMKATARTTLGKCRARPQMVLLILTQAELNASWLS